jgi:hypothetical protein
LACHKSIQQENKKIRENNKKINNDTEFGTISLPHLITAWRVHRDCRDTSQAWKVCTQHHYPIGWGYVPPEEIYDYDLDRSTSYQPLFAELTPRLMNYFVKFQDEYYSMDNLISDIGFDQAYHASGMHTLNVGMGRPMKLNIVDVADIVSHYYGAYMFAKDGYDIGVKNLEEHLKKRITANNWPIQWVELNETTAPGTTAPGTTAPGTTAPGTTAPGTTAPGTTAPGTTAPGTIALASAATRTQGGRAVFSIPQRNAPINCTITPGYTAAGDKIVAMQRQGAVAVLFVVQNNDGHRVVPSAEAGGSRAISAAENAGVPWTTTSENNTNYLKEEVEKGMEISITYVAVAPWNTTKFNQNGAPTMPFIIVGINMPIGDFHVSRSRLGKILGSQKSANDKCKEYLDNTQMSLLGSLLGRVDLSQHPQLSTFVESGPQKRLTYSSATSIQNPHYPLPPSSIQANQVGGYGQLPNHNLSQPVNPQYNPGLGNLNPQHNFGQPVNPQYNPGLGNLNPQHNFGQPVNPQYNPGLGNLNPQHSFGHPVNPQYNPGLGNLNPQHNFGQPINPQYNPGLGNLNPQHNLGQPVNPQYNPGLGNLNPQHNLGQPVNPQYNPGLGNLNPQHNLGQPVNPQYNPGLGNLNMQYSPGIYV